MLGMTYLDAIVRGVLCGVVVAKTRKEHDVGVLLALFCLCMCPWPGNGPTPLHSIPANFCSGQAKIFLGIGSQRLNRGIGSPDGHCTVYAVYGVPYRVSAGNSVFPTPPNHIISCPRNLSPLGMRWS